MKPITTYEEWYATVNEAWTSIIGIFIRTDAPLGGCVWVGLNEDSPSLHGHSLLEELERLRKTKDPRLANWLQRAWAAAPDSPHVHQWPGWQELCDLLSEAGVLFEETE